MKRTPFQIQKAVWLALLLRELKTRFGGRLVGLFWVLFEPLANIGIMLALRTVLRERYVGVMIEPAVYVAVAMIPFFVSRNIWMQGMSAVEANAGLMAYRQVKPLDTVVVRWMMEFILYIAVFACLSAGFAWWGFRALPFRPLEYMGVWLVFLIWGMALSLLSAVAGHRRPGVKFFIRMASTPLYLLSGVLIPINSFPPVVYDALLWNPYLHMVEMSREYFFPTYHPHRGISLDYPLYGGLLMLWIGAVLFHVNRAKLMNKTG